MAGAGTMCNSSLVFLKPVCFSSFQPSSGRQALSLSQCDNFGGAILGTRHTPGCFFRALPSTSLSVRAQIPEVAAGGGDQNEELWRLYFSNPSQWWDERYRKRNPSDPDFIKKGTRESLWLESESTPSWVKSELAALTIAAASRPPPSLPPRPAERTEPDTGYRRPGSEGGKPANAWGNNSGRSNKKNRPPPPEVKYDENGNIIRPKVVLSKELQDHIDIILKPIKYANPGSMRNRNMRSNNNSSNPDSTL